MMSAAKAEPDELGLLQQNDATAKAIVAGMIAL